ncbi:hypothetical protein V8D89_001622 [Ganoderma adspersum]
MSTPANTTDATSSSLAGLLALPPGLTMDNTYGAALLGTFFALIMYGVLLHQTYNYLRVHSGDSFWLKSYVAVIFLLDTAHSVLIMALCYLKLVRNYFNIPYLVTVDWPLSLLTAITAANVVACQSFFAYRVYQIDRKCRMVVWFCMTCQGAGFGLAIAFTVKASVEFQVLCQNIDLADVGVRFQTPLWTSFSKYSSWISVVLGIAVFVDTILAAVLVLVLHRSRTGVKATNSLLDTLIAYTVTTGVLTDLFNILGFVFALVTSQYLYYAAANMLGTKGKISRAVFNLDSMLTCRSAVYTNSVMAALNFRRPRQPIGNQTTGVFSDIRLEPTSSSGMSDSYEEVMQSKV